MVFGKMLSARPESVAETNSKAVRHVIPWFIIGSSVSPTPFAVAPTPSFFSNYTDKDTFDIMLPAHPARR